jgi:hypothetical protein
MAEESTMDIARIIGGLTRAALWTAKALMVLAAAPLLAILFFVLVIWAFYVGVFYFLQGWYLGRKAQNRAGTNRDSLFGKRPTVPRSRSESRRVN